MASRNCIYTGKKAGCTDKVIPKNEGDEVHNWANSVPCNLEYKELIKGNRMPTELEMEASKAFQQLEIAKQQVNFWEKRLESIQKQIVETLPEPKKKTSTKSKKEKEIKIAEKEKEIKELDVDKVLEKRSKRIIF